MVTIERQRFPGAGGLSIKSPKGRRARPVPIIEPLEPVLRRLTMQRARNLPLLRGPRGGVITTAALRDATGWDELVASLGLPGLRRHDLRRAGATWFANVGIPIHVVSDILGHASVETTRVAEEALHLLEAAATFGLEPGIADADKQYWANSKSFRLLKPALRTGFTPSTDYRTDRLGVNGGKHGGLFVEGDVYCPSTPKALLTATKDFLEKEIDAATYRARLGERKAYRLHVKEKAKADGPAILRCPALGPSPTVTCPLREMMMSAAKKSRPEVEPDTLEEEFLDTICKKHSASFDLTEMKSPQQAFDFGSDEWEAFHDHARNTVESENEQLKAAGDEDIATAGRRRVRGIAAAQILVTLLIVNHNLRKVAAFLSDQAQEQARTTPRTPMLRRRDRVWANRYTRTTGNGDLTIPRSREASEPHVSTGALAPDTLTLTPMRT